MYAAPDKIRSATKAAITELATSGRSFAETDPETKQVLDDLRQRLKAEYPAAWSRIMRGFVERDILPLRDRAMFEAKNGKAEAMDFRHDDPPSPESAIQEGKHRVAEVYDRAREWGLQLANGTRVEDLRD